MLSMKAGEISETAVNAINVGRWQLHTTDSDIKVGRLQLQMSNIDI